MNRPRKEPVLDQETAAAYAYAKGHDDSEIVRVDPNGNAVKAPPITLEAALELIKLAHGNVHPISYNPPKGRWQVNARRK